MDAFVITNIGILLIPSKIIKFSVMLLNNGFLRIIGTIKAIFENQLAFYEIIHTSFIGNV